MKRVATIVLLSILCLFALAAIGGCQEQQVRRYPFCLSDGDCNKGQVCVSQLCTSPTRTQ